MRLDANQLNSHLQQKLAPIYLICGDELLLVEECSAAVREKARAAGFERNVLTVETGFDWNGLFAAMQAPSLFAPRCLYELRLPNAKPGNTGVEILTQLAQRPAPNTLLMVITGRLDKAAQQSRWVQALEQAGVTVAVWPLEAAKLPQWLRRRLDLRGVQAQPAVAELLAHYMEGNLLAAAQEIDKLALLADGRTLELDEVKNSLSDNSRFSIYDLADACLLGDAAGAVRMLARLRIEGVEPVLISWALSREVRNMAAISTQLSAGKSEAAVFQANRVWSQRQALVAKAVRRVPRASWLALLARAASVDRILKGRAPGDIWHELEKLALAIVRPSEDLLASG
ncbi:MAG TPA: DNA polymerase III subunit delta [Acidiferrobacterales bacterium]|nr:DNA polymerase III subunit delta [Acidiferrobacterales bacterium]